MGPRIVIVDDSPQAASTLEIGLAAGGYEAVAVNRAAEAIAEVRERGAAAVVTDLDMPGMDGYELIARLRELPGHGDLIVIVVSGATAPDAEARSRAAGASAFFSKPCSLAALRAEAGRLLAERGKVES
jgi:two-component system CheB/CheR fusion protein